MTQPLTHFISLILLIHSTTLCRITTYPQYNLSTHSHLPPHQSTLPLSHSLYPHSSVLSLSRKETDGPSQSAYRLNETDKTALAQVFLSQKSQKSNDSVISMSR